MEEGLERCRDDFRVPSDRLGGSAILGDSGEKEGKEVRDLSEMDDAELDIHGENLRGRVRRVWER